MRKTPKETRNFRLASMKVLAGSVGGTAVMLMLTPVITRIFEPQTFGYFSVIAAVASIFAGVSTLRFEIFAQAEADERKFYAGIGLAIISLAICTIVVTAASALILYFRGNGLVNFGLAVGPIVAMTSLQLVGAAIFAHRQQYARLGLVNFIQQSGVGTLQVGLGLLQNTVGALIAGFAAIRIVWLFPIAGIQRPSATDLRQYWTAKKSRALMAGSSALINSAAGQALIILTSLLYGAYVAGIVAMATRLVASPLNMVGQAVSAAVVGEIGKEIRNDDRRRAHKLVVRGMLDNAAIAVLPIIAVLVAGRAAVPFILGDEWSGAGEAAAALALGVLGQFIVAPFSQVMNLAGGSKNLLKWDAIRLIILASSLIVPNTFGLEWSETLWIYAAGQLFVYALLAYWILRVLKEPRADMEGSR